MLLDWMNLFHLFDKIKIGILTGRMTGSAALFLGVSDDVCGILRVQVFESRTMTGFTLNTGEFRRQFHIDETAVLPIRN